MMACKEGLSRPGGMVEGFRILVLALLGAGGIFLVFCDHKIIVTDKGFYTTGEENGGGGSRGRRLKETSLTELKCGRLVNSLSFPAILELSIHSSYLLFQPL